MFIALLGDPYVKYYRGIYRKFPCAPKDKTALEYWLDCLELTQGFPIEYDLKIFDKLYKLSVLLKNENIPADLVLIVQKNECIENINTRLLGYDVTNDTMYYSILGEDSHFRKEICQKYIINTYNLLVMEQEAEALVEYMNQHLECFEKDGKYNCVTIELVF